ncbi:cytochrome P450 6d3-like [Sabethes cyaneus]|uniref:cytochrome P450 6d3-like n=1 Tax=Sabethes cyaneus TaxID=53552 RepID=UPI00237D62FF|nr:cytochrome P450 6d3-like [Sabethes cyaneus]
MFIVTLGIVAAAIYLGLKYLYSHWDRYGIPSLKPNIPFGNIETVGKKTESFGVAVNNLYHGTKGQLVGIYLFFRPAILIRDAHLAHRIMTTDFKFFHDRGVYYNEEGDPFTGHLFALPGKRWRALRNKFTPTFTSGQLRHMYPTILSIGYKFQRYLEPAASKNEIVDMRALLSRFMQEVVASVFFGYEANCINNPNDDFTRIMDFVQKDNISINFRSAATFLCPGLLKITGISGLEPEVKEFVTKIITEQVEYREKNNVQRKDFIQQLIELRREDSKNKEVMLSLEECAANIFLFYIAGSDTSTAAISFTLHELSQSPANMTKLQNEIDEMLQKSNGVVAYDVVKEMKFLDLCLKETLRKYPGLPILNRECTEDYQVPHSKVVIRKGTQLIIPLLGYGMSEEYFPEPSRYAPERFAVESQNYDEKAYYPFGEGPRNCIGLRMGSMVSKIGLVLLLSKYNFEATRDAKFNFMPSMVTLIPQGGIPLKITPRK